MMIPPGIVIVAGDRRPVVRGALSRSTAGPTSRRSSSARTSRASRQGVGVQQPRGPLFYLPVVLSDSFPWSLFLFAGRGDRGGARTDAATRRRAAPRPTLLWLWILGIVGFFSFSAGKQDLYIFPIVARRRRARRRADRARRLPDGGPASAGATPGCHDRCDRGCCSRSPALRPAVSSSRPRDASTRSTARAARRRSSACRRRRRRALVLAATGRIARRACRQSAVATRRPELGVRHARAAELRALQARAGVAAPRSASAHRAGDVVAHYNVALPSMVFYLRRHIDVLFDRDASSPLRGGHTVYAVLSTRAITPSFQPADSACPRACSTGSRPSREAEGCPRPRAAAGAGGRLRTGASTASSFGSQLPANPFR